MVKVVWLVIRYAVPDMLLRAVDMVVPFLVMAHEVALVELQVIVELLPD